MKEAGIFLDFSNLLAIWPEDPLFRKTRLLKGSHNAALLKNDRHDALQTVVEVSFLTLFHTHNIKNECLFGSF